MNFIGISQKELAEILRLSVRTVRRKMENPENWSAGELKRMRDLFAWSDSEIARII